MEYLRELQQIFPKDRVTTNETILEHHSVDESHHTASKPDVSFSQSIEKKLVRL